MAYSPVVQTWYVQRLLARQKGFHGSVDSVWGGFSQTRLEGLRLQRGNATLTVPVLDIGFPIVQWMRTGKIVPRSIVAKDWVLKFDRSAGGQPSGETEPNSSTEPTVNSEQSAIKWVSEALSHWEFPTDVAIDSVDLEGDVTFVAPETRASTIHVVLKGGGLTRGATGTFAVEASVMDERLSLYPLPVRGELKIAMETPRRIGRVEWVGTIGPTREGTFGTMPYTVEFGATPGADSGRYRLALARAGRHLIEVSAHSSPTNAKLVGDWKTDWQAADLSTVEVLRKWQIEVLDGAGKFDADPNFSRMRITGRMRASGRHWEVLAPWFGRVGQSEMSADFEVERLGDVLAFGRCEVAVRGAQLDAKAHLLRPVKLDWAKVKIATGDATSDWLEGEVRGVPLAWFSDSIRGVTFAGGAVTGGFLVGGAGDKLVVRSKTPWTVHDVSVRHGETLLAHDLDVSATIEAQTTRSDGAWQVTVAPMTFSHGGTALARIDGKASRAAGDGKPVALAGRWSADIAAIVAHGVVPRTGGVTVRSAAGDFSGTITGYVDLQGKFTAIGHNPTHTVNGTVLADFYPDGTVAFTVPLNFSLGRSTSDLQMDWEWRGDAPERGVVLKLKGKYVALDALRLVAKPLATFGQRVVPGPSGGQADLPFWGDWSGRVSADFERMGLAHGDLVDVGGELKFERGKVELLAGHGGPERRSLSEVQGMLTFDPTRASRYELHATTADASRDAESIFGPTPKDGESLVVGRFAVERSLVAKGADPTELMARREEVFKVSGKNGIVRMLAAGVSQALPSAPEGSRAINALDDVGSAIGRLFGSKGSLSSGVVKVDAATEAVLDLDLDLAEVGYDRLAFTAIRRADGTIGISDFDLVSPDLHVTATGEINPGKGAALVGERPVSLEMRFGAKGRIGDLMEKAGLLSGTKDAAGYRWVAGSFRAGGTLKHLDQTEWRAKLVEAAMRKTTAGSTKK